MPDPRLVWFAVVMGLCTRWHLTSLCEASATANTGMRATIARLVAKYDEWDPSNHKRWGVKYDPGVFLRRWIRASGAKMLRGSIVPQGSDWQGSMVCEVELHDLAHFLRRLCRIPRGVIMPRTIAIKRSGELVQVEITFVWLL